MPEEKVERYQSNNGKIKIKVTKNSAGSKVLNVEHENGDIVPDNGKISELKLANEKEHKRSWISSIHNDMTMETHASPECFWYFFGGQWWKICL
jgi:hypothetical protein